MEGTRGREGAGRGRAQEGNSADVEGISQCSEIMSVPVKRSVGKMNGDRA